MSPAGTEEVIDADAERLIRPYAVAGGRTRPAVSFHMVTYVIATGRSTVQPGPEHGEILRICRTAMSVAEVSVHARLPLAVTKILLADLLAWMAIVAGQPAHSRSTAAPDPDLLERVLDGLRNL